MTSFKLAISHRFRKSPPVQISSAHTALLQQQAGSPPDNIWHGADRQHDWCLPTTQDVPGISTSAEKAVPLLSLSYTALRRWLPCTANVHQAALIFIGTRSLQMYNAGCCRILSASVLFPVYAFNEKNYSSPIRKRDGMRSLCQGTSCTSCISLIFFILSTMNLTSFRS